MAGTFTPVSYDFRETIEEEIAKGKHGKVFFFNESDQVDSVEGKAMKMEEIPGKGIFITMDTQVLIRIDRIITLFGKPGAAYDEYDAFGNVCLSCTGGYPL
jgi:hypothetical protein